jgi:hypothetical protein
MIRRNLAELVQFIGTHNGNIVSHPPEIEF